MAEALLEIEGLRKEFAGTRALDGVSLSVAAGEIVALVGQNGSGKSTLVKVLAGVHSRDPGGSIRVRGALHFIHQDLGLIDGLSTVENLDVGHPVGRRGVLPVPGRRERRRVRELVRRFGGGFDVEVPVAQLSAGERAIVAIARALDGWTGGYNVLVLDEPTAALHGAEVRTLLHAVRRVVEEGAGVLFISHRLDEVVELADRVVALRDGCKVAEMARGHFDRELLVRAIVGRALETREPRADHRSGVVVLHAEQVSAPRLKSVSLAVRSGEVLGIAGLLGSGRDQLAGALFGAAPRHGGQVSVGGDPIPPGSPRASIARGLAFVPAQRARLGAVMTMSARENLTLPVLRPLRRPGWRLDRRAERRESADWIGKVGVRPPEAERPLRLFSGGNQQKVILAKWLRTRSRALLLDEPTQGVDVGAKAAIYDLIADAAAGGSAVLVCSSDAEELALVCDRALVLRDGVVAAELARGELTEARLTSESVGPEGGNGSDG